MLRQGMELTALGAALGLGLALALSRAISAQLFGISATDPASYAVVCALVLGLAALATLLPARRAMRADPVIALREE